jgi:hypothetical protein
MRPQIMFGAGYTGGISQSGGLSSYSAKYKGFLMAGGPSCWVPQRRFCLWRANPSTATFSGSLAELKVVAGGGSDGEAARLISA